MEHTPRMIYKTDGELTNVTVEPCQNENLIPSFNRSRPRFKALLRLVCEPIEDHNLMMDRWWDDFSLEHATGKQLDIIGALLGSSRILDFMPEGLDTKVLDDETYRRILYAKRESNTWSGDNGSLITICQRLKKYWDISYKDNQDCTITYIQSGEIENEVLWQDLIRHGMVFPAPAGIEVNFELLPLSAESELVVQTGYAETTKETVKANIADIAKTTSILDDENALLDFGLILG